MKTFVLFISFVFSYAIAEHMQVKETPVSPNFEKLRNLSGKWEGTTKGPKGDEKITLTYEVTAGGSAILERLFVGEPHEMISVYTQDGDKIMMTHYCMEKNQPVLQLKWNDGNKMKFEYVRGTAMNPKKDKHIHGLELTFVDKDHLQQHWTGYDHGKPDKENLNVTFARTK